MLKKNKINQRKVDEVEIFAFIKEWSIYTKDEYEFYNLENDSITKVRNKFFEIYNENVYN